MRKIIFLSFSGLEAFCFHLFLISTELRPGVSKLLLGFLLSLCCVPGVSKLLLGFLLSLCCASALCWASPRTTPVHVIYVTLEAHVDVGIQLRDTALLRNGQTASHHYSTHMRKWLDWISTPSTSHVETRTVSDIAHADFFMFVTWLRV